MHLVLECCVLHRNERPCIFSFFLHSSRRISLFDLGRGVDQVFGQHGYLRMELQSELAELFSNYSTSPNNS